VDPTQFSFRWLASLRQKWSPTALHIDVVLCIVRFLMLPPGSAELRIEHFLRFCERFQPWSAVYENARSLLSPRSTLLRVWEPAADHEGQLAGQLLPSPFFVFGDREDTESHLRAMEGARRGARIPEATAAAAFPRALLRDGRPSELEAKGEPQASGWPFTLSILGSDQIRHLRIAYEREVYELEDTKREFASLRELLAAALAAESFEAEVAVLETDTSIWREFDQRCRGVAPDPSEERRLARLLDALLPGDEMARCRERLEAAFDADASTSDYKARAFSTSLELSSPVDADEISRKRLMPQAHRMVSMAEFAGRLATHFEDRELLNALVRAAASNDAIKTDDDGIALPPLVLEDPNTGLRLTSLAFWRLAGSPLALKKRLRMLRAVQDARSSLQQLEKDARSGRVLVSKDVRELRPQAFALSGLHAAALALAMERHLEAVFARLTELPASEPALAKALGEGARATMRKLEDEARTCAARVLQRKSGIEWHDALRESDAHFTSLVSAFLSAVNALGMDRLPRSQIGVAPTSGVDAAELDPEHLSYWARNFGLTGNAVRAETFARVAWEFHRIRFQAEDISFEWVDFAVRHILLSDLRGGDASVRFQDWVAAVHRFGPVARVWSNMKNVAVPNLDRVAKSRSAPYPGHYELLIPPNADKHLVAWPAVWFTHLDRAAAIEHLDRTFSQRPHDQEGTPVIALPRFVLRPGKTPMSSENAGESWVFSVSVAARAGAVFSSRLYRKPGGFLLEGQNDLAPSILQCLHDNMERLQWKEEEQNLAAVIASWQLAELAPEPSEESPPAHIVRYLDALPPDYPLAPRERVALLLR
jgi:hypothetical protein